MLIEMKQIDKPTEIGEYLLFINKKYSTTIRVFNYYGLLRTINLDFPHNPAETLDLFHQSNYSYFQIPHDLRLT